MLRTSSLHETSVEKRINCTLLSNPVSKICNYLVHLHMLMQICVVPTYHYRYLSLACVDIEIDVLASAPK